MRFARRAVGIVTAASIVAAGLVGTAPAVAAGETLQEAPDPGTREDAVSAAIAAKALGRPVEITGATTETLRRWANPDGSHSDELSAGPVRTWRDGEWVPIDTGLTVRDGAVRTDATMGNVTFSAGGDTRLATVAHDGAEVSLTWPKKLPAPVVAGNAATYPDVLPGVDLEMKALAAGYEQSFILKSRAAASTAQLRVPVHARGLTPATTDGQLVFRDAAGRDRAWVGAARMWDAAGREAPVGVSVVNTPSGRALQMTPDAAFMADPSIQFPVTVDPTVTVFRFRDAYINQAAPTTTYGTNAYLKIGVRSTNYYVSYIEFPLSSYAGKTITNVTQYMGMTDSVTCSAKTTTIYKVETAWTSTVTWNTHPTTDLTSGGVLATATAAGGGPSGSACAANAWLTFNDSRLTAQYQAWADDDSGNHGMSIRSSSTDGQAAKDFASGENTSWTPRVHVTYNSPPTAEDLAVQPATSYTAAGGAVTNYVTALRPRFDGRAVDPEGSSARLDFEIWNSAGTTLIASGNDTRTPRNTYDYQPFMSYSSSTGSLGGWTVPSDLVDGTAYKWRARAYDYLDFSAWSSWKTFTVDVTTPPAPTISSTQYPSGAWNTAGGSGTFSWSSSATDVGSYVWGMDVGVPSTTTTSASVTTPVSDGWHTLSVRVVDKAGHLGPVATYAFGATPTLTSPTAGAHTLGSTTLESLTSNGASAVTYKYRRSTSDTWAEIPAADVTVASSSAGIGSWPVTWTPASGDSIPPVLNWDVASTLGADGSALVQVCFGTTSPTCSTDSVDVVLDRNAFGNAYATADLGVGEVSLLTGNLAVSQDDVAVSSYGSGLSLMRTANSRTPDAVDAENAELLAENQQTVETGTTGFTAVRSTLTRSAAQKASGAYSLAIAPDASGSGTDTYAAIGGDQFGGFRLGMQAGRSYLFTAKIYVPAATGLSPDRVDRGERVVAYYKDSAGVSHATISEMPAVTDEWVTLRVPFTVPTGATEAWIRLYNGFDATKTTKVVYWDQMSLREQGSFGLGWVSNLSAKSSAADYTGLVDLGASVSVGLPDDSSITFTKSGSNYVPSGDAAKSGHTLVGNSVGTNGPASFTLKDLSANTVVFTPVRTLTQPAAALTPNAYAVSTVTQPGSSQTTTFTYSGGRITQMLAPVPSSGSCTSSGNSSTWQPGCRALQFTYDASGFLTAVTLATVDPSAGTPLFVDVMCYAYTAMKLTSAWDPRAGTAGTGNHPIQCGTPVLATTYGYTAGRLSSITEPGLRPVDIAYDAEGRLSTVSRTHGASFNNGATETMTVKYGIPLTADVANPEYRPDLTGTAVAAWAQADKPVGATAVFGPGDSVSTSDLRDADVTYFDVNGRPVNTASFSGTGAAGWHVATTEYDDVGRVVRTLTAANRAEALNPAGAAGTALGLPAETAVAASMLDTRTLYSADGMDLTDTYGPYHLVTFDDGTIGGARAHTHVDYDTGTEVGHPVGGVLHVPVKTTVTASRSGIADPTQAGADVDARTTTTDYALDSTNTEGWTFRTPLRRVVDPTGLNLRSVTRYDTATGLRTESWLPKASDSSTPTGDVDKYKTQTVYFTAPAGSDPDDVPNCKKRAWVNLVCKVQPKAQPGVTGLPGTTVTRYTYDWLLRPTVVTDTVTTSTGTTETRTTTTTYDASGYGNRIASVSTSGGTGAAVPTVTLSYDTTTGMPTTASAASTAQLSASSTSSTFDDFGRLKTYTDADSNTTTTTTYDDTTGRILSVGDAKGTRTYGYSSTTEHRGLPTTLTVSGVTGSFGATYDADARVVGETFPNGLSRTTTYDEVGASTGLKVVKGTDVWWSETVSRSIDDLQRERVTSTSRQVYGVDRAGRLSSVADRSTIEDGCVTRQYTFDADSNRLASTAYPAGEDGACQTATGSATVQHSYDAADRLTTEFHSGLAYDSWNRITTLPSADAGGSTMTASYYANDLVRSQTQNGTTLTWDLDAQLRVRSWTDSASGVTKTNHYADGTDSPSWVAEGSTTWTRVVPGFAQNLVATVDQAGAITYQVTNLHGDVVATASASATTVPDAYIDSDEFGNPRQPTTARYGWLGGKQRSRDALGGAVLMGVRLYSPVLGRFLQVDPVRGGSANAYDYANQNPLDNVDLDGRSVTPTDGGGGSRSCRCSSWRDLFIQWSWWGVKVSLNRRATADLAAAHWVIAALVALIPVAGPYIAALVVINWFIVDYYYRRGYCVYFKWGYLRRPKTTMHMYTGGWCR